MAASRRTDQARRLIAVRRRALMFGANSFDLTPMEKLIELARAQGYQETSRVTAKCGACGASVSSFGIAHEADCRDPKQIELRGGRFDAVRKFFRR